MWVRLVFLTLLAFSLSGCGDTIAGKGVAEPEVKRFHEMLKRREFEAMYAATGEQFKSHVSKKKAIALFAAIDRKLGPLRKTEQINWHVNTKNLVTTVALVYESKFEDGAATETFTFRVQNGKPELIGYNIASMDMHGNDGKSTYDELPVPIPPAINHHRSTDIVTVTL